MTNIRWTDQVWNPVRGCSVVSPGCTNCYAMRIAHRFNGPGQPYEGLTKVANGRPVWTGEVRLVPEKFQDPFHWAKPRRVFVNSMSDLFHEDVPFEFIDKVFDVMTQCDWHKFQVLTKRPERMRQYMEGYCKCSGYHRDNYNQWARICAKNVWLGVSVEDQKRADERIPVLLDTPASLRFLSCEPLLGPVNLAPYINETVSFMQSGTRVRRIEKALHWVIVGGESGPRRRPMDLDWARQIRDECRAAGTDFYFKQTGGSRSETGQLLDGARWEQMP